MANVRASATAVVIVGSLTAPTSNIRASATAMVFVARLNEKREYPKINPPNSINSGPIVYGGGMVFKI